MYIWLENKTKQHSLKNPQILKIIAYAVCQKRVFKQSFFEALESIDESVAVQLP